MIQLSREYFIPTLSDPSFRMDSIPFNGAHGITSINHLPIEILGDIFLLCILQGSPAALCRPKHDLAPLSVSQVCRHWRETALEVPSLWCSLAPPHGAVALHPEFSKVWLARSRNLPLSLHLAPLLSHGTRIPEKDAHSSKIFEIFLNEMHRWRTISLVLNENLARQFIATVDEKAKILEELELYFIGNTRNLSVEISSLLGFFPKLRKLSWKRRRIYQTSLPLNIPFHQLTHIYISLKSSAGRVLPCLTKCTNAVEICWKGVVSPDLLYINQFPQTPLPQLQFLKLQGSEDLIRLLSRLTLPSLKCLHIQTSSRTWDHRLLEDFFNRSSCPLRQFILRDNLDLESAAKCLTIPFLGSIPGIEVHLRSSVPLDVFQELKDSHTPTLDRLKFAYPCDERSPVLMWE